MKYKNFHIEKPTIHTLIVWLNCQGIEVYGYYRDNLLFEEINDGRKGYLPKFWRDCTEAEHNSYDVVPEPIIVKRKYNKRIVIETKK